MVKITKTKKGYESSQPISEKLFTQSVDPIVEVVCDPPYCGKLSDLEASVREYVSSQLPDDLEQVKGHGIRVSYHGGEGKYIEGMLFQMYFR